MAPARLVALGLAVSLSPLTAADARWPGFQNGGDLSLEADASPWLGELMTAWTTKIEGHGQASPVVWDGRVYATSTIGENKETFRIVCLDAETGERLWKWDVENPSPKPNNVYTSRAAPTPAADEDGVIVFFEGGILAALTHAGELRWQRNLIEEFGADDTRFGQSGSVEQTEKNGFVWMARQEGDYVLAFDKASGETVWKVDGPGVTSWSSPRLVPTAAGDHLVLSGTGSVVGLDPETGKQLWRADGLSGNTTPTPVPVGEGQFLIGASRGRGEIPEEDAAASNALFEIKPAGEGFEVSKVWGAERATSSFGTPMAHGGLAWILNGTGVLYGLDAETGEKRVTKRLSSSMWATPVGVGDVVVFPTKDGALDFVSADDSAEIRKSYQVLPEPDAPAEEEGGRRRGNFGGPVLYGIAIVGDRMFVRDGDAVYCVTPAG